MLLVGPPLMQYCEKEEAVNRAEIPSVKIDFIVAIQSNVLQDMKNTLTA